MLQQSSTATESAFAERIQSVRQRIEDAAKASGRTADSVLLVAVSKTVDRPTVDLAYRLGLREFGENRVQDALAKFETHVPEDLRLHLIGPLQTNKARFVVGRFALVHSLDRESLSKELDKRARAAGVVQPVLIQVNVGREAQKHGCAVEELPALIENVLSYDTLELQGFMTMAPLVATAEEVRPVFAEMREIAGKMQARFPDRPLPHLSMGMTNDYAVAIEEGATIVRVGRAIFQETGTS